MSSPCSVGAAARGSAYRVSSRRCRAASLRRASMSRRIATVVSQARGSTRRMLGPDPQRVQQRLLQRVLGGVEVLAAPQQARQHLRDEGPQRALVQLGASVTAGPAALVGHDLADVDPLVERLAAGAGLGRDVRRELERALVRSTSIMYQPATRSLVSGCGPSVVTGAASGPP